MKDVLAAKKISPALQLSIQLTRLAVALVTIGKTPTEDEFRDFLLDHPDEILAQVKCVDISTISDAGYDHLCRITEDDDYDPGLAARESEAGFFLDLDTIFTRLRRDLETAHGEGKRLTPTTSFCIGVDGSRQSYMAFGVMTRLRRHGIVTVAHVNEDQGGGAHSIQLPVISSDFIVQEYKLHADRLRVPSNRLMIESGKDASASTSVASQLLDTCASAHADFLVLGTIGKGGPAIDQLGHVPRDVLRFTPLPVLLVPPAPIHSVPARSYLFVVAVNDGLFSDSSFPTESTRRCLLAVLKLMRSSDTLRLVHFYKKPLVGKFDEQRFEYCHEFLKTVQVDGIVDILALENGATVAESLHEYIASHNASYLVLGLSGGGGDALASSCRPETSDQGYDDNSGLSLENHIGRVTSAMLFSPRCTLCLCP